MQSIQPVLHLYRSSWFLWFAAQSVREHSWGASLTAGTSAKPIRRPEVSQNVNLKVYPGQAPDETEVTQNVNLKVYPCQAPD